MKWILAMVAAAACGGTGPQTRYYQLAAPQASAPRGGQVTLGIDSLTTDTAYDDERIVYRLTPYRLDYYQYHRWSSPPGAMIGNYLEQSFQRSGRFAAVVHDAHAPATVVLGGRVLALEEVDGAASRWTGRVVVALTLTDAATSKVLWTEQYEESEPLVTKSPEGLARAISTAMQRIATRALPVVADLAEQQAKTAEARVSEHAAKAAP